MNSFENNVLVDSRRVRILKSCEVSNRNGPVVYWMQRDQRVHDNWALLFAQYLSLVNKTSLIVVFNIVPSFLGATLRQYDFMLRGLFETKSTFEEFNIPLVFTFGIPHDEVTKFVKTVKASYLVTDFNPLRIVREWKSELVKSLDIPIYEVDAHNVVPAFFVSQKQEYGAYTLRPKIRRYLKEFLVEYPSLRKMGSVNLEYSNLSVFQKIEEVEPKLQVDVTVEPVMWLKPGESSAFDVLNDFLNGKLKWYAELRNDPSKDAVSNLSPYLHFGQISAQRVALEVIRYELEHPESVLAFLEELIVRRELADNFCFYNVNYDSFDGFPDWAKKTLDAHRMDKREYIYSLKELEEAKTHDDLWNAAQIEMVKKGKMHGYLRMYWAKKMLEWTTFPEEALKYAIYLNDKYELDGRDPNGYTGIAWAIGGVHDRPWAESPIFGMVRYMSYEGCRRKFNVEDYINRVYGR
ncbi:deoxyribodipyrimidine photo-lyase [Fervidobacterium sp.]